MMKIINSPVENEELNQLAEEIGGFYIKVVIDVKKEVMSAGAKMHVDEERMLLDQGSDQGDLWGGGYDLETKQVTYDSIINNKPGSNASSDILNPDMRQKFEIILRRLFKV